MCEHLCRACGLCCAEFGLGSVGLQREEAAWASSRRLPIVQSGRQLSFRLPCVLLRSEGGDRVCSDYGNRPNACRTFVCKLLARYLAGDVDEHDALRIVAKTRELSNRLAHVGADVVRKLDAEPRAREQHFDTQTLLDLGELQAIVRKYFFEPPSREGASSTKDRVERACSETYWRQLFEPFPRALGPEEPESGLATNAGQEIRREGYAVLGPALSRSEADSAASIVRVVDNAGWNPVFAFAHPLLWQTADRVERYVASMLGDDFQLLNAVWAWCIPPGAASRGWPPHRDRLKRTVDTDGAPSSLTVWVALTDATPENGCMYVLPPQYDPYYGDHPELVQVHDVQNIRAIPATAGTALAWNHQILHWGGRSSTRARHPRISIALEFCRGGYDDGRGFLERHNIPTFAERLSIIGRQILRYQRLGGLDRGLVRLAKEILTEKVGSLTTP